MVKARSLLGVVSALPLAVAGAFATPVVMSGDDALTLATRLVGDGKLDEADAVLRTLAGGDPMMVDMRAVDRLAAKIAYRRGDADRAIDILKAVVAASPDNWRIRYDLAHLAMEQHQDRLAKRQLKAILAAETDPAITRRVRGDLAKLAERQVFSARFKASAVPSTNINTATRAETFDFAGVVPLALSDEARARTGIGVNWALGGQYSPILGSGFRGHFAINGVLTDHSNKAFDQATLGGEAGLSRQFGARVGGINAKIAATYEDRRLGGNAYSAAPGVAFSLSSILSRRTAVRFDAALQDVNYLARDDRDGLVSTLSFSLQHAIARSTRLSGSIGYTRQSAAAASEASGQYSLSTGIDFAGPWGLRLGVHPTVSYRAFDAIAFAYGRKRSDWTADIATSIGHRSIVLNGFRPALVYRYTDNNSTVELFSYDRHAVDIAFSRAF